MLQRSRCQALWARVAAALLVGGCTHAALAQPDASDAAGDNEPAAVVCVSTSDIADTPDGWFERGRCAALAGRHVEAIAWFERILAIVDAPRTRLELARSLAAGGRYSEAADQFQAVLRSNPPEQVRAWVLAELGAIPTADLSASYVWRAGLGAVHDTNVNVGPRDANVTIFGLPFQLSDQSLGTADQGAVGWMGLERYQITPVGLLVVSARLDATNYITSHSQSYESLTVQAALKRPWANSLMTWSAGGRVVRQRNGAGQEGVFVTGTGTTGLGPDWVSSAALTAGQNRRYQSADANSTPLSAELTAQHRHGDGATLTVGVRSMRERFAADDQSHTDLTAFTAGEGPLRQLCGACGWSASASFTAARYWAKDMFFDRTRHDQLINALWSLTGPLTVASAEASATWHLSIEHSINRSTLELSRYDRTKLTLMSEWAF